VEKLVERHRADSLFHASGAPVSALRCHGSVTLVTLTWRDELRPTVGSGPPHQIVTGSRPAPSPRWHPTGEPSLHHVPASAGIR
jgi:hypothetical protein